MKNNVNNTKNIGKKYLPELCRRKSLDHLSVVALVTYRFRDQCLLLPHQRSAILRVDRNRSSRENYQDVLESKREKVVQETRDCHTCFLVSRALMAAFESFVVSFECPSKYSGRHFGVVLHYRSHDVGREQAEVALYQQYLQIID